LSPLLPQSAAPTLPKTAHASGGSNCIRSVLSKGYMTPSAPHWIHLAETLQFVI